MHPYTFLLLFAFLMACSPKTTQLPKEQTSTSTPIPAKPKTEREIKLEKMAQVKEGEPFPNGGVHNLDGKFLRTGVFYGKLLIIDFWATWCSPCLEAMPKFHELAKKYRSDQVEFISISIDDDFNLWQNYVLDNNLGEQNYWLGKRLEEPLYWFLYRQVDLPSGETIAVGVPRYVIASPEAVIINTELRVSRPGFEEELKKIIAKYQK